MDKGEQFEVTVHPRDQGKDLGLQISQERNAFVITSIASGGAADSVGLQVGDVILSVDGREFSTGTSMEEANSVLQGASDSVLIRAVRNGGSLNPVIVNPKPNEDARLSKLVKLIGDRTTDGKERLQEFGGPQGLARALHSDLDKGLCGEDKLQRSRELYGENRVPPPRSASYLELVWGALHDPTLIVLVIAGLVSLILGVTVDEDKNVGWIEGAAIMVSVLIVVNVAAINDLQKERQFQALQNEQNTQRVTSVIRNGEQIRINEADLLVGDINVLTQGAIVAADGILVRHSGLVCDESSLTGETKDIHKNEENPFILSGSSIKLGAGMMIVTCVGLFSEEGIIKKIITGVGKEQTRILEEREAAMFNVTIMSDEELEKDFEEKRRLKEEKDKKDAEKPSARKKESILQAKLSRMAMQIAYGGTFVAIITVLALFIRYFVVHYGIDHESYSSGLWSELLSFVIVGITVLVVAVPEGLPLAVTISLAYSVKKMAKIDHNLVRVLAACETMGNATTVCSDKTGTLTKNKMTVVRAWVAGKQFQGDLTVIKTEISEDVRNRIAQHIAFNSSNEAKYNISPKDGLPIQEGNKTECAILFFADRICARPYTSIRGDCKHDDIKAFPFDSGKKRMTTVIPLPSGGYRVFVKGAAEIVLALCVAREQPTGEVVPLSAADKEDLIQSVISHYAENALRVILIAYKDIGTQPGDDEDALASNLIISAFVGIQDPVRDEVPKAVLDCQSASVCVRMLTGDNMITARAIAYDCNILKRGEQLQEFTVMEGPDFRARVVKADGSLDWVQMEMICRQLRVMGRCSPTDKYNLVRGLRHFQEIVAVTGDGTNDGPALSEADVGFAMGIAGTGVAKEASDIIITDDNFSSIVKAISWGRNIYDSIAKFLVFQLTVNVVAITVAFIGACVLNESPLRAVQMLWVNLIMDSFASLALATEPPVPELLKRKPYDRTQPLISAIMLRQILGHSIHQLAISFMLIWAGESIFGIENGRGHDLHDPPTQHYTIVFNTFVLMQLCNEVNARKIHGELNVFKGIMDNWIYGAVLIGTFGAQILLVQFGDRAFRTAPLSIMQWVYCGLLGLTSMPVNILINFIPPTIFPEKWFAPRHARILNQPGSSAIASESSVLTIVEESDLLLPRTETMPLETSRAHAIVRSRPATLLWSSLKRNLQVVAAFQTAGRRLQQRRLTIRDVAEEDLPPPAKREAPNHQIQPMMMAETPAVAFPPADQGAGSSVKLLSTADTDV